MDKFIYITTVAIVAMIPSDATFTIKSLAQSTNREVSSKNSPYMEDHDKFKEFKKYLSTPPLVLTEER